MIEVQYLHYALCHRHTELSELPCVHGGRRAIATK